MPRTRRVLASESPHELAPRVEQGLPLPPNGVTNRVVLGVFARTQRDEKVVFHNYVWMNNHGHLHVSTTKSPHRITDFTSEIKKKLTDSVRALTGRRRMKLWEENTVPVHLVDLEAAITQAVYIFTNPAKAGLSDSIEEYPGLSSWRAFCECEPRVDASVTVDCAWYPVNTLPRLPKGRGLSCQEEEAAVAAMESSPKRVPTSLTLFPLGWLAPYGITDPKEIEEIRQKIILRVREQEKEFREKRAKKQRSTPSPATLAAQPYMKPHKPKNKDRKIFLICSDPEKRRARIQFVKEIIDRCRVAYQQTRAGCRDVVWPPGVFIPWLPPSCGCDGTS